MSERATNDSWEYRIISAIGGHDEVTERQLNLYGEKGWQVVAVGVQFNTHTIYLKRQTHS